jgi:hypothetical protein
VKASVLYRIAAVLLLLFAAGHTLGFRRTTLNEELARLLAHGFFFSVFLLFTAVVAWQLGGLTAASFDAFLRRIAWAWPFASSRLQL